MRTGQYFIGTVLIATVLSVLALAQPPAAITGPAHASVGELCVFTLNGSDEALADWTIVPPTEFYVDSSQRTLVFSTPKTGHFTIIAATIVEKQPLVLTFACDYRDGITPAPKPEPAPIPRHFGRQMQTKIKIRIWGEFLNGLETQIHNQLGASPPPQDLAATFRQIADGLIIDGGINK
jgi:hypothetical protein